MNKLTSIIALSVALLISLAGARAAESDRLKDGE